MNKASHTEISLIPISLFKTGIYEWNQIQIQTLKSQMFASTLKT